MIDEIADPEISIKANNGDKDVESTESIEGNDDSSENIDIDTKRNWSPEDYDTSQENEISSFPDRDVEIMHRLSRLRLNPKI